jgi:hypothetical protein
VADRIVSVETHAHLMPGRLFDANGQEVRYCRSANLDTGECVVFANDGEQILLSNGVAYINHERRPAPLTFVSQKRDHA